jgi:hypothetical protein
LFSHIKERIGHTLRIFESKAQRKTGPKKEKKDDDGVHQIIRSIIIHTLLKILSG